MDSIIARSGRRMPSTIALLYTARAVRGLGDGFATIVPCGVAGKPIVTLSHLTGRAVSVADAAEAVAASFVELFSGNSEQPFGDYT